MLKNGKKETYGDLLEHLQKQYALGTDQFLKTTTSAADVMGVHEIQKENGKNIREKNNNQQEKQKQQQQQQ